MTIEVGGVSGSILKPVSFTSGQIAAGASGDVITATAGEGQSLKITYLITATTLEEVGMTLTIDGVNLFSGEELSAIDPIASASTDVFGITSAYGKTVTSEGARLLNEINCLSFTLTKDSGTTINIIDYVFETMEAV